MGLSRYEFAARLLVDGQTLAPLTGNALPLAPATRDGLVLADMSRHRYGKPRPDIEAGLKARSSVADSDGQSGAQPNQPFGRRTKKPQGGAA